jgi:hypothetical protein
MTAALELKYQCAIGIMIGNFVRFSSMKGEILLSRFSLGDLHQRHSLGSTRAQSVPLEELDERGKQHDVFNQKEERQRCGGKL